MRRFFEGSLRAGSALMTAAMLFVVMSNISDNSQVRADWKKTADNTRLGTYWISNPSIPEDKDSPWAGNYVYYGEYEGRPIKFRVLDSRDCSMSTWNAPTLFLDCDSILFKSQFNDKTDIYDWEMDQFYSYQRYSGCSLRNFLNNDFLFEHFSTPEFYAIDPVQKLGGEKIKIGVKSLDPYMGETTTLPGDYIYILDVDDVRNNAYGYTDHPGWDKDATIISKPVSVNNRTKKYGLDNSSWWLRSDTLTHYNANSVSTGGDIDFRRDKYGYSIGVSPALNVDLKSIVFSSLVSGQAFETGAEFKLTINDEDLVINMPEDGEVSLTDREITVPYEIIGKDASNATQITYLITDIKYQDDLNSSFLYMDSMYNTFSASNGALKQSGEGKFELPSDLDINKWGEDYYVYVFAEDVNGMKETDYASNLVELKKPVKKEEQNQTAATPTTVPSSTVTPVPVRTNISTPTNTPRVAVNSNGITNNSGNTSNASGNNVSGVTSSANIQLTLDKTQAYVVCGNKLNLKASLENSRDSITWKSSDTKVATVDAAGKVTAKMAGPVTITASASGKTVKCAVTVLYKDVTDGSKFWFEPTNYLTAKGVVKGYDKQTKFKPANDCTRAQMVTFIWRLMGEPAPKTSKCKFSDVKSSDYYYKACIWGNENGIVEGYKNGTFGPKIVCARKHAVTFLWRLAGKPDPKSKTNKFSDVKKSDYFYKATLWASEKNILAGYSDGTFRPQGDCLRRQMVTFLYKYDKYVNGK